MRIMTRSFVPLAARRHVAAALLSVAIGLAVPAMVLMMFSTADTGPATAIVIAAGRR